MDIILLFECPEILSQNEVAACQQKLSLGFQDDFSTNEATEDHFDLPNYDTNYKAGNFGTSSIHLLQQTRHRSKSAVCLSPLTGMFREVLLHTLAIFVISLPQQVEEKEKDLVKVKTELKTLSLAAKEGVEAATKVKALETENKKLGEENVVLTKNFESERVRLLTLYDVEFLKWNCPTW